MKIKKCLLALTIIGALLAGGCSKQTTTPSSPAGAADRSHTPSALPDDGFKATISLVDPPAKLRAGEKTTIQVKVKNASGILWYARGAKANPSSDTRFILAAGDRWLNAADEKLVTDMDGRHGLNKDLRPGEETEIPLTITAPKEPGDYILEIDLVQEQVAWFHDKGSPTARTKVTVVR
ncbi:MAG TPA: hypothetical protein VGW76_06035 [Pyrinomonadaceae bacterium]|nr:hypothetical protein [Pyrinomonadaceae bacterium]